MNSDLSKGLRLKQVSGELLLEEVYDKIRRLDMDSETRVIVNEIFEEARNQIVAASIKKGKLVEFIARGGTKEKPTEEKMRGRPVGKWLAFVQADKRVYHTPTGKAVIGTYTGATAAEVIFLGREILRVVPEEILKISDEHQFVAELLKIDNKGFTSYIQYNRWKGFTPYTTGME